MSLNLETFTMPFKINLYDKIQLQLSRFSMKEDVMEERSLKVVDSNKTFFGKLGNTLSKIIIPTKIGINGFVINMKRNNLLKAYDAYYGYDDDNEDKKKVLNNRYQEAFSLYLEAIDKHIMDSVYKKVKMNTASEFEKKAMGDYYTITQLKENEYIEYKYRKQKYLIELDYESLKLNEREKVLAKYIDFYLFQMDGFYKGILKNYSVKLAETSKFAKEKKVDIYNKIFDTLDEYVQKILPIKFEEDSDLKAKVDHEYQRLEQFAIGELSQRDYVEKNTLLLSISRQIFIHSLPLVAAEECYEKLLEDIRKIIVKTENEKEKMESYNVLLDLLENYNIKLLSNKVYWEKSEDRNLYKKFWEKYQKTEDSNGKEVLFLKRELKVLPNNEDNEKIIKFYKERLVGFGVMKNIKNSYQSFGQYTRIKEKGE